ncbi:hypothetical protein [Ornithinibacillus scapharcae]|uniref:hypothetical protein n=1 Tax=Ornithinibacillus scapharcae TaxID=1147159 RepID=UPI000225B036|nr:hypothetical protein [Ornithinibacillus scapharcae]
MRMGPIINASLRSIFQFKSLIIVYLGIVLICALAIGLIGSKLIIEPIMSNGLINKSSLSYYIGIIGYSTAFILTGINYCVLFSVPLTRDKVNKVIESLLATASSVKEVWVAKSVALFIPGLLIGVFIPYLLTEYFSLTYLSSSFFASTNIWILLSTYLAVPVMFFCLSLLIHFVGLVGNVENGIVIASIFLPSISALFINLLARNVISLDTPLFFLGNIAIALILYLICMANRSKLNKEDIVLSCQS